MAAWPPRARKVFPGPTDDAKGPDCTVGWKRSSDLGVAPETGTAPAPADGAPVGDATAERPVAELSALESDESSSSAWAVRGAASGVLRSAEPSSSLLGPSACVSPLSAASVGTPPRVPSSTLTALGSGGGSAATVGVPPTAASSTPAVPGSGSPLPTVGRGRHRTAGPRIGTVERLGRRLGGRRLGSGAGRDPVRLRYVRPRSGGPRSVRPRSGGRRSGGRRSGGRGSARRRAGPLLGARGCAADGCVRHPGARHCGGPRDSGRARDPGRPDDRGRPRNTGGRAGRAGNSRPALGPTRIVCRDGRERARGGSAWYGVRTGCGIGGRARGRLGGHAADGALVDPGRAGVVNGLGSAGDRGVRCVLGPATVDDRHRLRRHLRGLAAGGRGLLVGIVLARVRGGDPAGHTHATGCSAAGRSRRRVARDARPPPRRPAGRARRAGRACRSGRHRPGAATRADGAAGPRRGTRAPRRPVWSPTGRWGRRTAAGGRAR